MYKLLFLSLCLLGAGCNHSDAGCHNKTYVISKATETVEEPELELEN